MATRLDDVLDYTADKRISVNKNDITLPELESRLRAIYEQRKDTVERARNLRDRSVDWSSRQSRRRTIAS